MREMKSYKEKYIRSVIKLGNSRAITFPQEWTNAAKLEEKSEVSLYPIDDKTLMIRLHLEDEQKFVFRIDGNEWPMKLIKKALISAFKLNIEEITLKYNGDNYDALYELLIELRREIIGLDFKTLEMEKEFVINFLLDTKKTTVQNVLTDLVNVFNTIIKRFIDDTLKENNDLLLAEIERKYTLGTRILITGLSEYPISKSAKNYRNLPIIRFLGDRVVLLKIKEFINESLQAFVLLRVSDSDFLKDLIKKYSDILARIPKFLINIIKQYENINLNSISQFQDNLIELNSMLDGLEFKRDSLEELQVRNLIRYYINGFETFFDIGITRMIEIEVGIT